MKRKLFIFVLMLGILINCSVKESYANITANIFTNAQFNNVSLDNNYKTIASQSIYASGPAKVDFSAWYVTNYSQDATFTRLLVDGYPYGNEFVQLGCGSRNSTFNVANLTPGTHTFAVQMLQSGSGFLNLSNSFREMDVITFNGINNQIPVTIDKNAQFNNVSLDNNYKTIASQSIYASGPAKVDFSAWYVTNYSQDATFTRLLVDGYPYGNEFVQLGCGSRNSTFNVANLTPGTHTFAVQMLQSGSGFLNLSNSFREMDVITFNGINNQIPVTIDKNAQFNNVSLDNNYKTIASQSIYASGPAKVDFSAWYVTNYSQDATFTRLLVDGYPYGNEFVQLGYGSRNSTFNVANLTPGTHTFAVQMLQSGSGYLNLSNSFREMDILIYNNINPVPIPATAWVLGSGLLGLGSIRRRFWK